MLAAEAKSTAVEPGGQLTLTIQIDTLEQAAYFLNSSNTTVPQQLAANRWLALRTLAAKVARDVPVLSECREPSIYCFVDLTMGLPPPLDGGFALQGAGFVVP